MKDVEMFTAGQSEKIALLFEECIDIPDPARRTAFLESACVGCPEIRQRVEQLLRAYDGCGRFLYGGTLPSPEKWHKDSGIDPSDLEPGGRVGPYRLLGLMGEGSTSTVFLAEQEDPVHRWVALKIVKPGMDSRKVIQRFRLERQALALMDHPGIAKLLDAGATSSGRPFFVMELVSGSGITAYCDDHGLGIPERLELFIRVCSAVLHAHQRGIIHRDIKPDNILVTLSGNDVSLKIIDFGIAKVLHTWSVENATRTGMIPFLGTPAYMSPEQVRLNAPDLDTRTDIYSLGALLYELLTGHPPFDHERLISAGLEEMFRIIKHEDPPAPSVRFAQLPGEEQKLIAKARGLTPAELVRALKGDLDWICMKALEKDPDRRYSTAEGMADDIGRHFKHQPVTAAAPGRRYRLVKMLKRNRRLLTAAATVTVLLLTSTIFISVMAVSERRSARQARVMEQAATEAEAQSHQAMLAMHVSSGMSASDDNYNDRALLWFANAARLAGEDSVLEDTNARRAINWISKVPLPVGAFKLSSNFRKLEFSKDSRYLLSLGNANDWSLWNCEAQELADWPAALGPVNDAAWSPSGSELAIVLPEGEIRICNPDNGRVIHQFAVNPAPQAIGYAANSRHLVFSNTSLHVIDLENGESGIRNLDPEQRPVGLSFAGDSTRIIGVNPGESARIFEFQDGLVHGFTDGREFPHKHFIRTDTCTSKSNYQEDFLKQAVLSLPAMTSNGNRLLTRTGAFEISLWDLDKGTAIKTVDDICCSCRFVISPESDRFACGIQGGKVGIWDINTANQQQLLPSTGACILDISFGENGNKLITAETTGKARVWSIQLGKEIQSPLNHCTDVDRVAYSGDGRMVATGQSDGLVRIWNVLKPDPMDHLPDRGEVPTIIKMDKDGSRFVLIREPNWESSCDACLSQITVYSADTGEPVSDPIPLDACVEAAGFSAGGNKLAVGMAHAGEKISGRLEIYDINHPQLARHVIHLDSRPADLAWNPTREEVAVICRGGELVCLNLNGNPKTRWRENISPVNTEINPAMAFARNGDCLVILGPDSMIHVLDSRTGRLRYPPLRSAKNDFWSISLSPDEIYLAASTSSGAVMVWNLETGKQVGPVMQHPKWVYRARFSPDQKFLITASHDGKARLWDWKTGRNSGSSLQHPNEVYDAVFTPDSKWILTACRDGKVRAWDPQSGALMAPPVWVGHQAFNIELNSSGTSAFIGNLCNQTYILSMESLLSAPAYGVEELCLLAEAASSSHIVDGSLHTLETNEWLSRYTGLEEDHPEVLVHAGKYGLLRRGLSKSVRIVGQKDPAADGELHSSTVEALSLTAAVNPCETCVEGKDSCPNAARMN